MHQWRWKVACDWRTEKGACAALGKNIYAVPSLLIPGDAYATTPPLATRHKAPPHLQAITCSSPDMLRACRYTSNDLLPPTASLLLPAR